MTFLEAALAVLTKVGSPLHVEELTQKVLEEKLLSHVGKTPQEVMESRLLAMARKPRDRKIGLTAPHTFCLTCWGLTEDQEALDLPVLDTYEHNTGPLLRGRERDPDASPNKVRFAGRGERTRGQWREENVERRQHMDRVKSVVDAALEILRGGKTALLPVALAAAARDRDLISDDLGADALTAVLKEDNRKRLDAGKTPLFDVLPSGEITLHTPANVEGGASERSGVDGASVSPQKLMALAADQRRATVRALLRRIGELDGPAFGKTMQVILERNGFTDLKVARRNRDGAVLIARKKTGLMELRYAIRIIRGNSEVAVQDITEHSRNLAQYGSQIGMVLSAAPVARDVIQAAASAVPPIFLFCGDALAKMCLDQGVGVTKSVVEIFEVDEEFFRKNGDQSKDDRERRHSAQASGAPQANSAQNGAPAHGKPSASQDNHSANGKQNGQQPSVVSSSEDGSESEKKQAKAEGGNHGGEQRRLSKKERYRQRREAKDAARRMAAAAKAKAAAQRASQESGLAPAPAETENGSNCEANVAKVQASDSSNGSIQESPTSDVAPVAEQADARGGSPDRGADAEGKSPEKKARASVYDPGKFGNFSPEMLVATPETHSAESAVHAGADANVEDVARGAGEDPSDASALGESDEKSDRRGGGRNRARFSRRKQVEKAAGMKATAAEKSADEPKSEGSEGGEDAQEDKSAKSKSSAKRRDRSGKGSKSRGDKSKSAPAQEGTESPASEVSSESHEPSVPSQDAPRESDVSASAPKAKEAPVKVSEESGQAGDS